MSHYGKEKSDFEKRMERGFWATVALFILGTLTMIVVMAWEIVLAAIMFIVIVFGGGFVLFYGMGWATERLVQFLQDNSEEIKETAKKIHNW